MVKQKQKQPNQGERVSCLIAKAGANVPNCHENDFCWCDIGKKDKEIQSLKKELESANKKVKKYWADVEYLEKVEGELLTVKKELESAREVIELALPALLHDIGLIGKIEEWLTRNNQTKRERNE